jgi:hypothetical protein
MTTAMQGSVTVLFWSFVPLGSTWQHHQHIIGIQRFETHPMTGGRSDQGCWWWCRPWSLSHWTRLWTATSGTRPNLFFSWVNRVSTDGQPLGLDIWLICDDMCVGLCGHVCMGQKGRGSITSWANPLAAGLIPVLFWAAYGQAISGLSGNLHQCTVLLGKY